MNSEESKYNEEPVTYCKLCLSLKIRILDEDVDYCDNCSCTDTAQTDIHTWEKMWEAKYGKPFNELNKNGREEN